MRVLKMLKQTMSMKSPGKHFDINATPGIWEPTFLENRASLCPILGACRLMWRNVILSLQMGTRDLRFPAKIICSYYSTPVFEFGCLVGAGDRLSIPIW